MNIIVIGIGYVGFVIGVFFFEIGYYVICIDIDVYKIDEMRKGIFFIFELGFEELMRKNIVDGWLNFEMSYENGLV